MVSFDGNDSLNTHYRQLLGLTDPWRVNSVKLDPADARVEIRVEWPAEEALECPKCGKSCSRYDYREERRWRHLDTMQFKTEIVCSVPRCECKEHGVQTIRVPWAEPGSRFTMLFERLAIDVLLACQTKSNARKLLGLSWAEVHRIQERAVARGLVRREAEQVCHVGMDEKSFGRGHNYVTVMTDIDRSRVLEVVSGRDTQAAKACWDCLGDLARQVEAVAMDMWDAYAAAARERAPQAAIVHDHFHVSKHLNEAVDKVRKKEHAQLRKEGKDWLGGMKYIFLRNPDKWTPEHEEAFEAVQELNLKVADAWALKEDFKEFWQQITRELGKGLFNRWERAVKKKDGLEPLKKVAAMLRSRLANLLNYFEHRITNAHAEGFNSKIQSLKALARGFRNFENYRATILFHCGKLSLYPQES
jgi:transposase